MRKHLAIFMAILMLFALVHVPVSHASVGIKIDGSSGGFNTGNATSFNFKSIGGALSNDGSTWTFELLLAGIGSGGATSMTSADLAIPLGFSFVRKAISADPAFIAGTLADGKPGQLLTLYISQDDGSQTFTVTPATSLTFATAAFDSVGDQATFFWSDDTNGWSIWSQTSVTVTLIP